MSFLLRIIIRAILNTLLIFALAAYLPQYIGTAGGWQSLFIVGAVVTLLNIIVRPLLNLVTFPLRLLMSLVAIILVNAVFLWITQQVLLAIDPALALDIRGGIVGWLVISLAFGVGNWIMKMAL